MWMQLLAAGGLSVVGEAFPLDWRDTFYEANPRGFFESTLVNGINFTTNPNPVTGARLVPEESRNLVVKVFAAGVCRSEAGFLDRVVVSTRGWRSYRRSALRAQEVLAASDGPDAPARRTTPLLRWWFDHANLILDAAGRGYPMRFVRYEQVLERPGSVVPDVLRWLSCGADVASAVAAVEPGLRTVERADNGGLQATWVVDYDRLEAHLDGLAPVDPGFLSWLRERSAALRALSGPPADPWADRAG